MIDANGIIYEGRPLDFKGAHVGGANTGKIGIALIGNFEPRLFKSNEPTKKQIESMVKLVEELQKIYSINNLDIGTHSDYSKTKCPGKNLFKIVKEIYYDELDIQL